MESAPTWSRRVFGYYTDKTWHMMATKWGVPPLEVETKHEAAPTSFTHTVLCTTASLVLESIWLVHNGSCGQGRYHGMGANHPFAPVHPRGLKPLGLAQLTSMVQQMRSNKVMFHALSVR